MSNELDLMYRDVILDHYRSPRGRKPVEKADFSSEGHNPACGDDITLKIALNNGTISDVLADSRGCAISTASGSIMAEILKGKTIEEAKTLAANVKKMLKGEDYTIPDNVGDIDALEGVKKFPVRIKCALLAWMTLLEGIKNYESGRAKEIAVISTESGDE
jgi:nitrogen fixation NifU-like protein